MAEHMTNPYGEPEPADEVDQMTPVVQPTQVEHPWKATARTVLQVLVALASLIPLVVAGVYQDANAIPAAVTQVLVVATAVTRVMAIPQVNDFLAMFGLGAEGGQR